MRASPLETIMFIGDCGERGRNRTYNLLIKSQLLCQLSYAPKPLFSVNYDRCHFVKSGIVS